MAETWLFWTFPWVDSSHSKNLENEQRHLILREMSTQVVYDLGLDLLSSASQLWFILHCLLESYPETSGIATIDKTVSAWRWCHKPDNYAQRVRDCLSSKRVNAAPPSFWSHLRKLSQANQGLRPAVIRRVGVTFLQPCKGCLIPELEMVLSLGHGNANATDVTVASPWLPMTVVQFSLPAPVFPFLELPSYICFQLHTISVVLLTDNR